MKNFIENVKQRPPHERRQVAARIAAGFTAVLVVGWLATLGVRLASTGPTSVAQAQSFGSQVASVFSAFTLQTKQPNTLEVASTSSNY